MRNESGEKTAATSVLDSSGSVNEVEQTSDECTGHKRSEEA